MIGPLMSRILNLKCSPSGIAPCSRFEAGQGQRGRGCRERGAGSWLRRLAAGPQRAFGNLRQSRKFGLAAGRAGQKGLPLSVGLRPERAFEQHIDWAVTHPPCGAD